MRQQRLSCSMDFVLATRWLYWLVLFRVALKRSIRLSSSFCLLLLRQLPLVFIFTTFRHLCVNAIILLLLHIGEALLSIGPNDRTIPRCPQKRSCQTTKGLILGYFARQLMGFESKIANCYLPMRHNSHQLRPVLQIDANGAIYIFFKSQEEPQSGWYFYRWIKCQHQSLDCVARGPHLEKIWHSVYSFWVLHTTLPNITFKVTCAALVARVFQIRSRIVHQPMIRLRRDKL